MRRLILFSLAVNVALVLIISLSVALGRRQPPPAFFQQLHLTDCALPCWAGITPGKTAPEGAHRHLTDIFTVSGFLLEPVQTASNTSMSASGVVPDNSIQYTLRRPSETVSAASIWLYDYNNVIHTLTIEPKQPLRLGDVVNVYGPPLCVLPVFDSTQKSIMIIYSRVGGINMLRVGAPFSWTSSITTIQLSNRTDFRKLCAEVSGWHGLSTVIHFRNTDRSQK